MAKQHPPCQRAYLHDNALVAVQVVFAALTVLAAAMYVVLNDRKIQEAVKECKP